MIDSFQPVPANLIDAPSPEVTNSPDGHGGYTPALAAQDTLDQLRDVCGSASRDFPRALWLDSNQRADKARENDVNHTWGLNYLDRFTNQDPTHECTTHMVRAEFEGARNRARGIIFPDGPKKGFRYDESITSGSVWVSPLSIYSEANPNIRGGASCRQVLEIALKRGFLPEKIQPRDYGFKHTLVGTTGKGGLNQSSGDWVRLRDFPEGWEETAMHLMPDEVIFTSDWEEALCLLLWGYVLGYGRSGHAIPPCIWNVTSNAVGYADSYDVVRWDSMRTFKSAVSSGVHCIASVTTPDDWSLPAGGLSRAGDFVGPDGVRG